MMRACALLAFFCVVSARAQNDKVTLPKTVAAKLEPYTKALKAGTAPGVEEFKGGFKKTRFVATEIKTYPSKSDFADKDFKVRLNWQSQPQESKIYKTKEEAEKSQKWETAGRVVGTDNAVYGQVNFNAVLYYKDGKWELESISFFARGMPSAVTVDKDSKAKHPWWNKLVESQNLKKENDKRDAKKGDKQPDK